MESKDQSTVFTTPTVLQSCQLTTPDTATIEAHSHNLR